MSLSLKQLQIVYMVATSGSVTAAAEALGVSQPAVSMLLRDCSRDAGFPLFMRRQGRLQPTAETRTLLTDLERVFDGVDRIGRLIDDMGDTTIGSINITATAVLADNILPTAIAQFQQSRPRIQISIKTTDTPRVIASVVREEVDLGLALSPLIPHDARAIDLVAADLIAVVHSGHELAQYDVVGPQDILPYRLISFSRAQPIGALVEKAFREAKTPRRIAIKVNQSSVACALARAGAGVAVIDPFWLAGTRDSAITCLKFHPTTPINAQVLVSKNAPLSRPARMFIASMRRTVRDLRRQGLF